MNGLHVVLSATIVVFVAMYVTLPRHHTAAFAYARYAVLVMVSIVMLAPFAWLLAAVFKDKTVFNEFLFLPPLREWSAQTLNLSNFRELFAGRSSIQGTVYFWRYMVNSVFIASTQTVLQLAFSSMAGYALAKFSFRGRTALMTFVLGSMMIPSMVLVAPSYKMIVDMRLVDTYWALLVPSAISAYGIFLFRQAMASVPDEIIEAGRMDGCGELAIYMKLVMPLVRPMSAAFCLVSFLGTWNSYLAPNIVLHSQHKLTLPIILNLYVAEYAQQYGVFLAGTLLALIPPAVLFFALQKEFISGLTSGAVKQ